MSLNVLITGAASGIGKATKDYFLKEGHNVYALDLNKIEKQENLVSFEVDISNKEKLINVRQKLLDDNAELDVIINCAGIHKMASLVEDNLDKIEKVIDINLLGTMKVNNIFHQNLKKDGRILIITSEVASLDPMPFNGLYSVSKSGLDCYAQALRQELNLIGQKVVTIRPGAIKTPLSANSMVDTQKLADETKLYQKQACKFFTIANKFMGTPIKPEKLAKLIYKAATRKRPKLIYQKHRNLGLVLLNILPKRMQCFIIKLLLK